MNAPSSVLVVGASAAGLGTAEALRRKGYQGRLTLLGAEPHAPYDRPPLSKQVLSGAWTPEQARLRPQEALDDLGAEFVLGDPAVALDAAARAVRTASGRDLRADAVVIATGLRARTLPGQENLAGVHTLRSLDDAQMLRTELLAAERAVVVGDGVLGAEIAATAAAMGVAVTLAGPRQAPMAGQLGLGIAGLLADLHRENGVELRLGETVGGLPADQGKATGVRLGTGEVLPAEVVVVAIGAVPETGWLTGSGLSLDGRDHGVVCDARCRAAEGIYAVGDVAHWYHAGLGVPLRLENRTNAVEQATAAAGNILGENQPYIPIPYFWTDQFTTKIQMYGRPVLDGEVTLVEGSVEDRRFVVQYRHQGQVTGVLGWNMPKQARLHRQALLAGSRPESAGALA